MSTFPPAVRLPFDSRKWHLEYLHQLAWYEMLHYTEPLITLPPPPDTEVLRRNPRGDEMLPTDRYLLDPKYAFEQLTVEEVREGFGAHFDYLIKFIAVALQKATGVGLPVGVGHAQAIAEVGPASMHPPLSAGDLVKGATFSLVGCCQADLFLVCNSCGLDRAVIEFKGLGAKMNYGKKRGWQTDVYEARYRKEEDSYCQCLPYRLPLFVLLDVRSRSGQEIEFGGGRRVVEPRQLGRRRLSGPTFYRDLLSSYPFRTHPTSFWLLGDWWNTDVDIAWPLPIGIDLNADPI